MADTGRGGRTIETSMLHSAHTRELAKLPERERWRVRAAYWQALDDAINEGEAKQRLLAVAGQLEEAGYTAAARCLADDLGALVVHLRYRPDTAAGGAPRTCSSDRWARSSSAPR